MMKKGSYLLALLLAALMIAACGPREPTPSPARQWTPVTSLEEIRYDPNTPDNILVGGKRIFQNACSACHELPSFQVIKDFPSDKALLEAMIPMTEQSELPMDYSEKVIRYLLAIRHNAVP